MKKLRNIQASISASPCTKLSKTRFFPVSIVKSMVLLFISLQIYFLLHIEILLHSIIVKAAAS